MKRIGKIRRESWLSKWRMQEKKTNMEVVFSTVMKSLAKIQMESQTK